jgi:hypothetical protein
MTVASVEVLGTVRPDGSLELDQKVSLPPGRVKVRLESFAPADAKPAEGLADFVQRLRQEALAGGSTFMNEQEVTTWIEELRAEDDRIEDAYRQAEEERRQRGQPGC